MRKTFSYPTKPSSPAFSKRHGAYGHALPVSQRTLNFLKEALREDVGHGDITSNLLIPARAKGTARVIAKRPANHPTRPQDAASTAAILTLSDDDVVRLKAKWVGGIQWIIVDVRIQIHPASHLNRVRLHEPARGRRICPRSIVIARHFR